MYYCNDFLFFRKPLQRSKINWEEDDKLSSTHQMEGCDSQQYFLPIYVHFKKFKFNVHNFLLVHQTINYVWMFLSFISSFDEKHYIRSTWGRYMRICTLWLLDFLRRTSWYLITTTEWSWISCYTVLKVITHNCKEI